MKEYNKLNSLLKGDIHIETNFFDEEIYKSVLNKISSIKTVSTFQPFATKYGNRMQAMPCYESKFNFYQKFIINKIQEILEIKINKYHCTYRKIKTEEIKKSQCTGRYGFTHIDGGEKNTIPLAAIMHLDQSYDGGTAFFEYFWDKKPDIYVSAYPNRLVIYNGNRLHAPAFDHSFKERHSLAFFFNAQHEK